MASSDRIRFRSKQVSIEVPGFDVRKSIAKARRRKLQGRKGPADTQAVKQTAQLDSSQAAAETQSQESDVIQFGETVESNQPTGPVDPPLSFDL